VSTGRLGGRPARDHRRVLDAIFWIARTGAPWRDLPPELGNWNSVFRQFRRWTASGLWDVMLEAFADGGGDADLLQMIDSTSIRAHHCAAGGRGGSSPWSWPFARWPHEQTSHPRQRAWPAHRLARDRRAGG